MHIESPNWYWSQIGADVVRNGLVRTVYIHGIEVCHKAGYETEIGISRWLYEKFNPFNQNETGG
jgi:hypothetical protein